MILPDFNRISGRPRLDIALEWYILCSGNRERFASHLKSDELISLNISQGGTKMPVRKAEATWEGKLRDGKGTMKVGSGAFQGAYSFSSRFENGVGTNPEELIGAAHAGCFSMALSLFLEKAGYSPESIHTTASVHIDKVGEGFKITSIELEMEAKVPGIDEKKFLEQAEAAKQGCPVSQALAATEIKLKAKLAA
jgi:lipoyl-dependent peroxiredoxin